MTVASLRERFGPAVGMGVGLVVVGLAGYGFLGLSGHTLSTADTAAIASFYLVIGIVGPGVFTGVEQETSRTTSAALAVGRPLRVTAAKVAAVAAGLLAVVLLLLTAVSPLLTDKALGGNWGLFLAVVLGVAGSAAAYVIRGLLGGAERFTGYAVSLTAEGLSRIVLCVAVVLIGSANATVYALVFASGSLFALLAGLPWLRHRAAAAPIVADQVGVTTDAAGPSAAALAKRMSLLVGATLGFQTVANLAPILVTARLSADTATAAAFASAFVMVRVPVLLFAAVQAMLLPVLTRAVTVGDLVAVRATLRKIMLLLVAIGVPTVLGATAFGPWAAEFFFGAKVRLPAAVVGLLAVSTILLMVTQVLLPALVALARHRVVTVAWIVGGGLLIAMIALPIDPVWTAVWAQLAGCGLVAAIMGASLARALRAPVHEPAPSAEPVR